MSFDIQCTDSDFRLQLHKLRYTWKDKQFPYKITHELDNEIKAIDPNWPITAHKPAPIEDSNNNNRQKRKSEHFQRDSSDEESHPKQIKVEFTDIPEEPTDTKIVTAADIFSKLKSVSILNSQPTVIHNQPPNVVADNVHIPMHMPPQAIYENYCSSVNPANQFPMFNPTVPVVYNQQPVVPFTPNFIPMNDHNRNYINENNDRHSRNHRHDNDRCKPKKNYAHCWSELINGFPQMPRIGTDPRFLMPCPFIDDDKRFADDNDTFVVKLDRVQPYVLINGNMHALRYKCSFITVIIDGVSFQLSTNEVNIVWIRGVPVPLCIGGPFHELIIDGWPYHVPMDGETYERPIGPYKVPIAFDVKKAFRVKIMQPIPKFVCDWAEKVHFGHPKFLFQPPQNPLDTVALSDPIATQFRTDILNGVVSNNPVHYAPNIAYDMPMIATPRDVGGFRGKISPSPPPMQAIPLGIQQAIIPLPNLSINMDMLQMIVKNTQKTEIEVKRPLELDLAKYHHDEFKKINDDEVDSLHADPPCEMCGVRLPTSDPRTKTNHMDYHFHKNSLNQTTLVRDRGYLKGSKSWVHGQEFHAMQNYGVENDDENEPVEIVYRCRLDDDLPNV